MNLSKNCSNAQLKFDFDVTQLITIELLGKCVNNLKLGKACGSDDLGAEHFHYAHPIHFIYLKLLFCSVL